MNTNTPISEIYAFMRSLKGCPPKMISTLKDKNINYCTILDIANKLGRSFEEISSRRNSPREDDSDTMDFNSSNLEEYNENCSKQELFDAI